MKWEMETSLEKIWDLHDKISDAIHGISSTHFFKSTLGNPKTSPFGKNQNQHKTADDEFGEKSGFVFVKELGVYVDDQAIAEARSLNGIRTALENLEDQLEFFNTVQLHQRVEREAAIARLEQSRVILAMKLANHHGQKYKVIEEALSFVGDVHEAGRFGVSENASDQSRSHSCDNLEAVNENNKTSNNLMQFLMSGMSLAKKSLQYDGIGSILGNCTLFAVSMLAVFQLHQRAIKSGFDISYHKKGLTFMANKVPNSSTSSKRIESFSQDTEMNCHLEVLLARG